MACVSEHIFEGNDKGQIFSDKIKVILTKITKPLHKHILLVIGLSGFCDGYPKKVFVVYGYH